MALQQGFLQYVWEVIKRDIMCTIDVVWHLGTRNFHSINKALMTLIPKTAEANSIKDYLPISLIHSIGKLFSKVLASRLAVG
jgi:hypothetical protein